MNQDGKCFFINNVTNHWIVVEYKFKTRWMTHYDTLSKGCAVAQRLKKFLEVTKGIQNIKVTSKKPIVKLDGYNCGVHEIELVCQLAKGVRYLTTYLTRRKIVKI